MGKKVNIMVMSGVQDGTLFTFSQEQDGHQEDGTDTWSITIGRRDESDICLKNDTFVSREHAYLHWRESSWWLEDRSSTNGTFSENAQDFFNDTAIKGTVPVKEGQLFRVGRTWLRIHSQD